MEQDFSIRKEIEIQLKENLSNVNVDIDEIYGIVENDELMLDMISLSIYTAISEQLEKSNIQNEDVDYKINQLKEFIVKTLMNRGII